jgi:hypothetical protein
MKRLHWSILGLSALLLLLLLAAQPSSAQTDVIIGNADATWTGGLGRPNALIGLLDQVVTRVVIGAADADRNEALVNAPASLRGLLDQVPVRVYFDSANGSRIFSLAQMPSALQSIVAGTAARTVINMANGTRVQTLSYPRELIGDSAPPAMQAPSLQAAPNGAIDLVWVTDEFTTVVVRYGTASGAYTREVSDPLFAKEHRLRFTDLQAGVIYYFKFTNTDRSGNVAESEEYALNLQVVYPLYLPSIRR